MVNGWNITNLRRESKVPNAFKKDRASTGFERHIDGVSAKQWVRSATSSVRLSHRTDSETDITINNHARCETYYHAKTTS